MAKVTTIAKKWGSSLGVIIPKSLVDEERIKENDEVTIEITSKHLVNDLFGKFPEWKGKKTAQQLKDEMRKGWD